MITRTQVKEAILANECVSGWSETDKRLVEVKSGHLRILIEAAKCARYKDVSHSYAAQSDSEMVLDMS